MYLSDGVRRPLLARAYPVHAYHIPTWQAVLLMLHPIAVGSSRANLAGYVLALISALPLAHESCRPDL